ncbi:MAG TPA: ribosome biogenesis GTP-binding protein YihA/YsxC [Terriglobales bacterium]|nr:ribosome biogenesis GTP-binding protein YihA/YsxC [Terriglobales bacterium]
MKVFAQFLAAATDVTHFPAPGPPEIAFLGRSNVGKSSVINSLLSHKVARTSSTPGRTRGINFYAIRWPGRPRPDLYFTDLPGYGYAKVAHELSAGWHKFIEPYLKERPNLALCISLVDPNIPPQPGDQQLCEFLRAVGRPHLVVATKADRMSNNQLQPSLQRLKEALGAEHILCYSARTGAGRDELWKQIRRAVGSESAIAEPLSPLADSVGRTPSPS